jgi:WD40 repeat protein
MRDLQLALLCILGLSTSSSLAQQKPPIQVEKNRIEDEEHFARLAIKGQQRAILGKDEIGLLGQMVFSPDGLLLASAHGGEIVQVWDATTHKDREEPLVAFTQKNVYSLAFSPDSKTLASLGSERMGFTTFQCTLQLWDVAERKVRATVKFSDAGGEMVYSPDGKLLVLSSEVKDKSVLLLDPATGKEISRLKDHATDTRFVTFSPNGKILAVAGSKGEIYFWDMVTRKQITVFRAHPEDHYVTGIVFTPDGKQIVSCANRPIVRVHDVATTDEIANFKCLGSAESIALTPDGKTVVVVGFRMDAVKLYDMPGGKLRGYLPGSKNRVTKLALSPDGKVIASGGLEEVIRLWNMPEQK